MKFGPKAAIIPLSVTLLLGCANPSRINEDAVNPELPTTWQQQTQNQQISTELHWLEQVSNAELSNLVKQAINGNRSLKQQAYNVEIQAQSLNIADAELWPEIDFGFTSSRQANGEPRQYANNNNLSLDVSYELDIWGKLSDSAQQAQLTFLATKANYQQSKNQLIADVINAYFELASGQQLSLLFDQKVKLAQENLDIISSGYKQGLNEALDVYLARNDLNAELSSLASQQAKVQQLSANLEQLIGKYPAGKFIANQDVPVLINDINTGLPSNIIKQKPALQASWYELLAQDAALAFAHKQRFPSIRLSGSYGSQDNELDNLLSSSAMTWSLLGSITMPVFNAGKLKANEQQQALKLQQQEQAYLDNLYQSFAQVEQGITQEQSIKSQYNSTLAAQDNALIAQTLAFEQYQSGLVNYTTVLDAQERAFNAQSNVISLKNQMLANRVNLYLALGGDFNQGLLNSSQNNEIK